jgi:RNA polymerase sigma-70 factor (ECF subfamily)
MIDAASTIPPLCPPATPLNDIGALLRMAFAEIETAPLPARLQGLLDRLASDDAGFKAALAAAIPHLRAYGRSLSGSADLADDLVQETMLKAWTARDRFVAGTSMRAWTHVILRNIYFSMARRNRFKGAWDAPAAERLLAVRPAQDHHVALADLQRALLQLPAEQREALILIGASGLSCEEAAAISNCAVGTVKSRVARARAALHALLDNGQLAVSRADVPASPFPALAQIMQLAQMLADPARQGAQRAP